MAQALGATQEKGRLEKIRMKARSTGSFNLPKGRISFRQGESSARVQRPRRWTSMEVASTQSDV